MVRLHHVSGAEEQAGPEKVKLPHAEVPCRRRRPGPPFPPQPPGVGQRTPATLYRTRGTAGQAGLRPGAWPRRHPHGSAGASVERLPVGTPVQRQPLTGDQRYLPSSARYWLITSSSTKVKKVVSLAVMVVFGASARRR